jgi:hypothetical protein
LRWLEIARRVQFNLTASLVRQLPLCLLDTQQRELLQPCCDQ